MIVVTAASGQFGRLAVESLLNRGIAADTIRAVVRTPAKVADLAARGVEVVQADYTQSETLVAAFQGAEKVLFVSTSGSDEERLAQHLTVVPAAKTAGVGQLVYTSIPQAQTNPIRLAEVHKATETAIVESGLPHVFLRNNWYFENTTASIPAGVEHGALIGSAGEGRIGYASRADFADAAAAVLTTDGHTGKTYELTGDVTYSQAEVAAEVAKQTGKEVGYVNLPQAEYEKALVGFGLPPFLAALLADADVRISEGALAPITDTLSTLIGRPTTTLAEAVAAALKG